MSLPATNIHCTHCDETWGANHVLRYSMSYQLTSDISMVMPRGYCWCDDCKTITVGERFKLTEFYLNFYRRNLARLTKLKYGVYSEILIPPSFRTRRLRKIPKPGKAHSIMDLIEYRPARASFVDMLKDINIAINDIKQKLLFHTQRQSNPRCLSCRKRNIRSLKIADEKTDITTRVSHHPTCGGKLYWQDHEGLRLCMSRMALSFNIEGNEIDKHGALKFNGIN
jgi:hypothetical protein